ncbi:MAG TPA: hypothetical protein VNL14_12515 [Candidatus Acidoferrales bacterium]|nr:hypothetical protein [Candidatus Acidoferrales bacterium]
MKDELNKMTEDISKMYEEISNKTSSLGSISTITRLYDELQSHLRGISIEDINAIENQIKMTLERLLAVSKSLNFLKAIKLMMDGQNEAGAPDKA